MSEENLQHQDSRWYYAVEKGAFVFLPSGMYPVGADTLLYALDNYEDQVHVVSQHDANKLVNYMAQEGYMPTNIKTEDDSMEEMAHRHLDIIEEMVNSD